MHSRSNSYWRSVCFLLSVDRVRWVLYLLADNLLHWCRCLASVVRLSNFSGVIVHASQMVLWAGSMQVSPALKECASFLPSGVEVKLGNTARTPQRACVLTNCRSESTATHNHQHHRSSGKWNDVDKNFNNDPDYHQNGKFLHRPVCHWLLRLAFWRTRGNGFRDRAWFMWRRFLSILNHWNSIGTELCSEALTGITFSYFGSMSRYTSHMSCIHQYCEEDTVFQVKFIWS